MTKSKEYMKSGTDSAWYKPRHLTNEEREVFRQRSKASAKAKAIAMAADENVRFQPIYDHSLNPSALMPKQATSSFKSLSLFSGGGGLDLGFENAGLQHVASYELLDFAAETLNRNRPEWSVFGGHAGDVTSVDWTQYRNAVDIVHGGPPCQPFSTAGRQTGELDPRDMLPQFVRCVNEIVPTMFVMENVPGITADKFRSYLQSVLYEPLQSRYKILPFELKAADFGVPQTRKRKIFVGVKKDSNVSAYAAPMRTHIDAFTTVKKSPVEQENFDMFDYKPNLPKTMGVREALGMPDIGFDALSPTIRCSLTGPRGTTSVLSSTAAQRVWQSLMIWPNGVARDPLSASKFATKNGHFRLCVADVALLQGFPEDWVFEGAVHKSLGQIGNSVAPPVAYWLGRSLVKALSSS